MSLPVDSGEYELLVDAANASPRHCAWIEIGTRAGGSAEMLMRRMEAGQTFISVDPYGGIPYKAGRMHRELHVGGANASVTLSTWTAGSALGYTQEMRYEATCQLFVLAQESGVNFVPLPLEDTEFMRRFADGVPIYLDGYKRLANSYGLVFLDGPHDREAVIEEMGFFVPRLSAGGRIVIDDIELHPALEEELRSQFMLDAIVGSRKMVLWRVGE